LHNKTIDASPFNIAGKQFLRTRVQKPKDKYVVPISWLPLGVHKLVVMVDQEIIVSPISVLHQAIFSGTIKRRTSWKE